MDFGHWLMIIFFQDFSLNSIFNSKQLTLILMEYSWLIQYASICDQITSNLMILSTP